MKRKKILYIATTADSRNRMDGETIKCKLLRDYLVEIKEIQIKCIDTDNWQKHIFKLVFLILFRYLWCDEIIVSSADRGAHIVLNFFDKIKTSKKIYYFVIGGSLARNIKEKNWPSSIYKRIVNIYVEADTLKNDLNNLGINNVTVLNNFRRVNKFKNNYKKNDKFKFVYFGRIIKEKGIEEACKLVNRLNENNIKCSLDIYGQCKQEYLEQISKYFSSNIIFHGEIKPNGKDEYEELSKYDAFVFPTEYPGECLPGALIDCYISGLAVLASNWKYAKEYINNYENGIIFNYKDYDDMYNKAIYLIKEAPISKYKEKSVILSRKYNIDELLKNFKEELIK